MATNTIQFDATVDAAALNKLLNELRSGTAGAAKAINDLLGGTVTKKIVLQEVADGSGTKKLVAVEKERLSVTDQIISKQKQLTATQAGSVTSLRQQLNSLKQARDATVRYEQSASRIGGSLRQQRAEWAAINAQVSQVSRQLAVASASGFWEQIKVATRSQGLINISNGLVGITQGFQAASILAGQFLGAINSVVDASAKLQSFALAFRAIGAGSAGAVAGLQESAKIALGLGVDLNTVQEGFRQLSPVVLNSGGTLKDVSAIVESLSSRFAAFGISGDRARRVMNGVIQAFAKGKLQAEELTQQISEADPAFKTDLAAALLRSKDSLGELGREIDGTVPGLEKLVKAGKLTADVLIKVLPEVSKSALLFGKLGPTAASAVDALERGSVTIDQVRANLQNLNDLSLRELALSSEPLINALLRVQAVITDTFSRISRSSGIDVLSGLAAKAVEVVGRLADAFFVLAEGAINVVGALGPIVDLVAAIAEVPGVAQVAGVALLGKFLGPLKLLEGRTAATKAAFQGLRNGLRDVFKGSRAEIAEVTQELKKVEETLGNSNLSQASISKQELDALRAGSAETATFAQRQRGLTASKRLLLSASVDLSQKLSAEEKILERLQKAQAQVALAPISDKARATTQARITKEIERTTNSISILREEQGRLNAQTVAVDKAIQLNAKNIQTLGGTMGRTSAAVSRFASNVTNFAVGAVDNFRKGISGILGLLDPLLVIMLAVGVGARLYADGTRQATEATQRYAEQSKILQAAINDVNPGLGIAKEQTTALGRAWDTLAVATVGVGDALASVAESFARLSESGINRLREVVSGLNDEFVNLAGSIALVSGATALGAALGSVGGPVGIAVLGTVGAIVGVVAALGLGSSKSAIDLKKLDKELNAIDDGSASAVKDVSRLATALEGIQKDQTGNFSQADSTKITEGYKALSSVIDTTREDINRLTSAQQENANKDELARRRQIALRIKANKLLEEGATEPGKRDTLVNAAQELRDPGLRQRNQERTRELAEVRKEEKALEEQRKNSGAANTRLEETIGKLSDRERQLLADQEKVEELRKKAAAANVKYANTVDEITAAIKTLQEENTTLELGDPKSIAKFDKNIVQIKELQGLLEDLGKTPVELQIEASGRAVDILNSQDAIAFDPGPLREARKLVREIGTDIENASSRFEESAEPWAKKIRDGTDKTGMASEQLREAGQKFAQDVLKGTSALQDQLRSLEKSRAEAGRSLTGLVLSKPEFFTPQEVRSAVAEAGRLAQQEAEKAGVTFTPKGGNDIERAQENLNFAEARNQANDLRKTIIDIGKAVELIAARLLADTPKANELLKKYGLEAKDLVRDVGEGVDGIAGKAPRIGEVFGEITSNGQATVLYFDNLTGQTESLSRAAFDRLKREQDITTEVGKQSKAVAESLKLAGASKSTPAGQAAGGFRIGGGATGSGPDTGGIAFGPGGTQTAEASAEKFREIARRNGGEYIRVLAEVIASGGPGFAPQALLGSIQSDTTAYRQALEAVKISQAQATQAQAAYNQALAAGSPDIVSYAASLANAKLALEQTTLELEGAAPGYQQAATTARELGIALDSVPSLGEVFDGTEVKTAEQSWRDYVDSVLKGSREIQESSQAWNEYAAEAQDSIDSVNELSLEDPLDGAATGATTIEQSLTGATAPANSISDSLSTAADNAASIRSSIDKLRDLTVEVKVNGVPGFFTGGPVTAGQEVRVNELGREGFLSRGGNLSPINVPANATWRPPTSGTIIPAHIWDKINLPSGRVKVSKNGPSVARNMSGPQAQELGILGRAVESLAGQVRALTAKEWTVRTNVRNSAGNTQIRMMNAMF